MCKFHYAETQQLEAVQMDDSPLKCLTIFINYFNFQLSKICVE